MFFSNITDDFAKNDVIIRTAVEFGTVSETDISEKFFLNIGKVSGKTDINGETDLRINAECAGRRSAQSDFLLNRTDTADGNIDFAFCRWKSKCTSFGCKQKGK